MDKNQNIIIKTLISLSFTSGVVMVSLLNMSAQIQANLSVHVKKYAPVTAVAISRPASEQQTAPKVQSPPLPTPKAVAAQVPQPSGHVVVAVPKVAPHVLAPVPSSAVKKLVPIATSPSLSPSPSPSNGPSPSSSPGETPTMPASYSYSSTNWSGYVASGGVFTGVSGNWSVPSPTGNGYSTSADATWIGIGGITSSDLIQVGTQNIVSRAGRVSTAAFFEMLPAASVTITQMTVTRGDVINASISEIAASLWRVDIADLTNNQLFSIQVAYSSSHSSAEWIQEDPSYSLGGLIPFDNYGSVTFSDAGTIENARANNLIGSNAQSIEMVNGLGQKLSLPSNIETDGQTFEIIASGG